MTKLDLLNRINDALKSKDMAEMKMRLCLMESELMGEAMATYLAHAPRRI